MVPPPSVRGIKASPKLRISYSPSSRYIFTIDNERKSILPSQKHLSNFNFPPNYPLCLSSSPGSTLKILQIRRPRTPSSPTKNKSKVVSTIKKTAPRRLFQSISLHNQALLSLRTRQFSARRKTARSSLPERRS